MSAKQRGVPFSHESKYYVEDPGSESGYREIVFKIYPSKLNSRQLAGALVSNRLYGDLRQHYASELASRVSHYLEGACDEGKISHDAFREVFKNNIEEVLKRTFFRRYKHHNYQDFSGKYSSLLWHEKELNAAIFVMKLRHTIEDLASDEYIQRVCKDYSFIMDIRNNPDRFPELENTCAPQLGTYMRSRIGGLDPESQRQEGLLALWAAARDYRAESFAPFARFAKVALQHKFSNLLRYTLATKRRVHRHLVPMGGGSDGSESLTSHQLDAAACEQWVQQQAIYDALRHHTSRDAFMLDLDEGAQEVLDGLQHHAHVRTLSPNEINRELLNLHRGSKRAHYNGQGLENFEDEVFFETLLEDNCCRQWKKAEASDETFPHLNERHLDIEYGIDRIARSVNEAREQGCSEPGCD